MTINQLTTDTSVVATAVALAVVKALFTNEVPLVIVPTVNIPRAAAPVDPMLCLDNQIKELEVTDVVDTVAVPEASVTEPHALAPADVVVPTLADKILLPAVWKLRLPVTLTVPLPASILVVEVELDEPIVIVFAEAPEPIFTAFVPAAVAILTVAPDVVALAIETVVEPEPLAIRTLFDVPVELPRVIAPV